jgi:peptidyl-prolyl cis-trans isomerase C
MRAYEMKYKSLTFFIIVATVVFLNGCSRKPSDKEPLASIDNKYIITIGDFNNHISKLPERYQSVIWKNKEDFLNELIVDTLLYNEAVKRRLNKEEEVREVIQRAEKKILIARLLQEQVEDNIVITEEEIDDFYSKNKNMFTTPEAFRASHILVKTKKEAEGITAKLSKGADFEALARTYSADQATAAAGGDIGYFTRNQLVPEFEEACLDMKVGEISGVIKTDFGYHIIKLTEIKKPEAKKLSLVRNAVEESLRRLKKKVLFNEFVESLRGRSKISINDKALDKISAENKDKGAED